VKQQQQQKQRVEKVHLAVLQQSLLATWCHTWTKKKCRKMETPLGAELCKHVHGIQKSNQRIKAASANKTAFLRTNVIFF